MFETVDLYCERMGSGFWAEPVNALTNALFLLEAWYGWRRANVLQAGSPGVWLLIALMCAIGVGSFLFHTFAANWSRLLDFLPILLFQLVYLWLYCREVAGIRFTYTLGIVPAYLVSVIIGKQFPHLLNGSLIYGPAMIALLLLGIYHAAAHHIERYVVLAATGMFVVSLTFRTLDNAVCPYFPAGTHFIWHVCNALILYLLLRALLSNRLEQHRPNRWFNLTPETSPALRGRTQ